MQDLAPESHELHCDCATWWNTLCNFAHALGTRIAPTHAMTRFSLRQMAVVGLCVSALAWSSMSLHAEPEIVLMCCSTSAECGPEVQCCSPESLGLLECDSEDQGYCQTKCVRGGLS